MKKTLVAGILGIGLSMLVVGRSNAQGFIVFENYYADDGFGALITESGVGVSGFNAALYYEIGTATSDPGSDANPPKAGLTLLPATGANADLSPPYPTAISVGYFTGPVVTIPGYSSGPVTFEVVVYNGTSYTSPDTTARARSGSFVESSLATNSAQAEFFLNSPAFQVQSLTNTSRVKISGETVNQSGPVTLTYATPGNGVYSYHIETTTNLATLWTTVPGSATNTAGTSVTFTDTTSAGSAKRFYRIASP